MASQKKRRTNTSIGVGRTLSLLESLARSAGPSGVLEISRRLGIEKSAIQRMLNTMEVRGWVRKDATMKYSLGLNALCLGARALNSTNLVEAGGPVAKKLAQSVGETVFIGVRDGLRVVFLYKAVGRHAIRFEEQIGASADLHTTALGKAILGALNDDERALLLAQLDFRPSTPSTITDLKSFRKEIARAHAIGYAASDEEHLIGVLGLAAPIRGMWGEVVGAIVVTGPKWRMDASRKDIGRLVVEAAEMISAELGFGPVERTEAALVS